jgi:cyclase
MTGIINYNMGNIHSVQRMLDRLGVEHRVSTTADEIVFLDIEASRAGRLIDPEFIRSIGEEANMPFSVGGGIQTLEDIRNIIRFGAERVIIGAKAVNDPDFIREASEEFGSSTITVFIDVKQKLFSGKKVFYHNGKTISRYTTVEFAKLMEEKGAGELIVQSIDQDGTMDGYDLDLLKNISIAVKIPVVALGGAGKMDDLRTANNTCHLSGLASGSLFVFKDQYKGVLINYPENKKAVFEYWTNSYI